MSRWPSSFTQCISVSTRLRRWYSLHFCQLARPRYFDARRASFRAMAPAVDGFHGLATFAHTVFCHVHAWHDCTGSPSPNPKSTERIPGAPGKDLIHRLQV